jgi:hypothetical protein
LIPQDAIGGNRVIPIIIGLEPPGIGGGPADRGRGVEASSASSGLIRIEGVRIPDAGFQIPETPEARTSGVWNRASGISNPR